MRRTIVLSTLIVAACAASKPAPSGPAPSAAPSATSAASTAAATSNEVKAKSAADLVDHLGDSVETAVPTPIDAKDEGVDFENNWIYDRFGRFRRLKWGVAHAGEGPAERRYKVITFELPDHSQHTVYFDMTELWLAWKPSAPAPPK
jgi:hypothetical protein